VTIDDILEALLLAMVVNAVIVAVLF